MKVVSILLLSLILSHLHEYSPILMHDMYLLVLDTVIAGLESVTRLTIFGDSTRLQSR